MTQASLVAGGLGWPEGPAMLAEGSLVFVESYRGQLTLWADQLTHTEPWASVGGAPNSCAMGASGEVYVCQNGGTVGPWRADTLVDAGIQIVGPDGSIRYACTEIDGIPLNGPNDLAFGPDGSLYFTDPGTYRPHDPQPSRIFVLHPDGSAALVHEFSVPVFPNGIVVEADGSVVWDESYTGRVGRIRPDGALEDLGRLPGPNPLPDGMAIDSNGRLFITDLVAGGLHILEPDGTACGFLPCGTAPTNCAFAGETLYVTDAGVLAESTEPSFAGAIWAVSVPGGGLEPFRGSIP
jgi:gluconolactonase